MPGMGSSALDFGAISSALYSQFLILFIGAILLAVLGSWAIKFLGIEGLFAKKFKVGVIDSSVDDYSKTSRAQLLRIAFGVLWVIDGLFQLRPDMPGGFVANVALPVTSGMPTPIASFVDFLLRIWNAQPTKVDITTAFIQIFIGVGLLFLGRSFARKVVLYLSLAWSLFVLVVGNGFGILYQGAGWISGAPGAIVIYGFISVFLIASESGKRWTLSDRALEIFIAAFLVVGGLLQALPYEGYWNKNGLNAMLKTMAQARQPAFFSSVINSYASFAFKSPTVANGILVALTIIGAIAIFIRRPRSVGVAIVALVSLFGWWIGSDFGIFSSTATDFNSGLPLVVVVLSLLLPVSTSKANAKISFAFLPRNFELKVSQGLKSALVRVFGTGVVLSFIVASVALLGPASSQMALVDSSGVAPLPATSAPNFSLTNANGKVVSLASLGGRAIVLTFLDPVCYDTCPLMAQEMKQAVSELGASGKKVAMVAVVANPIFHSIGDVATFNKTEHLNNVSNWYYLTGSDQALAKVWKNYGIQVQVSQVGMVVHTQVQYFIDKAGIERGLLVNTGSSELSGSYVTLIRKELQKLI
ncbi:AhpC/TSA family protein [Acidithrix ferrooxidans]|uniref:AhpC/TSA family protein n=2 Tax=Acidithrix ferrooxidans TaxID=1280514 RepID=A0A0D8HFE4_9ACTN|nr:AhpC/TSA family protein [Acidithrix ferrooxidans]